MNEVIKIGLLRVVYVAPGVAVEPDVHDSYPYLIHDPSYAPGEGCTDHSFWVSIEELKILRDSLTIAINQATQL